MTIMLELRERLKVFYNKNNAYMSMFFKFMVALLFFMNINSTLGFMKPLNNMFVVLVLALICSLLSFFATMGIGFVLVIGHCYEVGIEVALFALVLLLVLLIFYLRLAGEDAVGVILTPLAFAWHIPCAVPMGLGLLRGPSSAFASVCGIIFYHFIAVVKEQASVIQGIEQSEMAKKLQILIGGLIKNQNMWLVIVASVAVVIIVYSLRRMMANYAWSIAIIAGGICYLVIMFGAGFFMDAKISIFSNLVQVVIACAIAFLLKFFVFNVDYTRTESLQYEDDDYYYYVRAIPKINIARQRRSAPKAAVSQQKDVSKQEEQDEQRNIND